MVSFTNQALNDIPDGMTSEEYTRMYAAWGRFCDLSRVFIPWNQFLDYTTPETVVIGKDEGGNLICETTIRLRYSMKPDIKLEPA